jgi:hypothetical protein
MKNDDPLLKVIAPFYLSDFVFRVVMGCLVILLLLALGWTLGQFLYLMEETESMR